MARPEMNTLRQLNERKRTESIVMESLRIVIADDEPIIRLDLRKTLENMGHQVVGEAGDVGIDSIPWHGTSCDLRFAL